MSTGIYIALLWWRLSMTALCRWCCKNSWMDGMTRHTHARTHARIKALKANHSPRWEHIQNKNTVRTCDIYAVRCLKVLDSELKAYSGIVKNLGKEAEKLKKTDPANAKEIAAEQVDSCSVVFILWMLLLWAHSALCFTAWFFELCKFNFRGLWKHIFTEC